MAHEAIFCLLHSILLLSLFSRLYRFILRLKDPCQELYIASCISHVFFSGCSLQLGEFSLGGELWLHFRAPANWSDSANCGVQFVYWKVAILFRDHHVLEIAGETTVLVREDQAG